MSRSRKKVSICRDNSNYNHWKLIRNSWNHQTKKLKKFTHDYELLDEESSKYKNKHSIISQWDICDWRYFIELEKVSGEFTKSSIESVNKFKRK